MAKVIWTDPAIDDLARAYDFIAQESQYVPRRDACYIIECIHSSRDLISHIDPSRWLSLPPIEGSGE